MTRPESTKQDGHEDTPRRNRPEAIARAAALAAPAFARAGFSDPALVLRWPDIVGPEIARMAVPSKLSEGPAGGTLTLRAEPAASVFLQHETRSICERINRFLGRSAVAKLRFETGDVARPPDSGSKPRSRPDLSPGDPAQSFGGPEPLKKALAGLGRARQTPD